MTGTPIRLALVAVIALTVASCATVPELTAPPETPPALVVLYAPTVEHRVEIGNNIIVTWDAIRAADRYVAVVTSEDGGVTHAFPTTETSLLVVPPAGRWWLTVTASRGERPGPSSTPVLVTIPAQPAEIARWAGDDTITTDSFQVPAGDWVIDWTATPMHESGLFTITVYDAATQTPIASTSSGVIAEKTSKRATMQVDAERVYLVISSVLMRWEVEIVER